MRLMARYGINFNDFLFAFYSVYYFFPLSSIIIIVLMLYWMEVCMLFDILNSSKTN